MKVSIVIRVLNEARYLGELLRGIHAQAFEDDLEVVVIDSGSTDGTLSIARSHGVVLTHIAKEDFSFGRSLNQGCSVAKGDVLVFISGHCIPVSNVWLSDLVRPIKENRADYVYGRQVGRDCTKYSENQIFRQMFPPTSCHGQKDYFCNNANAALRRCVWHKYKFNEKISGLEDMELAKRLQEDGGKVMYAPKACVYHIHNETWRQVAHRFAREVIGLNTFVAPSIPSISALAAMFFSTVTNDCAQALKDKCFWAEVSSIVSFRLAQHWGIYQGYAPLREKSAPIKN